LGSAAYPSDPVHGLSVPAHVTPRVMSLEK
jgi:hypothetical protein